MSRSDGFPTTTRRSLKEYLARLNQDFEEIQYELEDVFAPAAEIDTPPEIMEALLEKLVHRGNEGIAYRSALIASIFSLKYSISRKP